MNAAVTPRELQVLVIDSGRGLRAPAETPGLGFGLKLMAETSDVFDAVERGEGGTEVRLVFGLDAAATAGQLGSPDRWARPQSTRDTVQPRRLGQRSGYRL